MKKDNPLPLADAPRAIERFDEAFKKLTGWQPFDWQKRLFALFVSNHIPTSLDLPTGLGKTSVMAIWCVAREANPRLPRRLAYVVDRRAVVDQATEEAEKIRENFSGETLRVSTLRGQFADNKGWLKDPAAPAIIVGTVDMIGSRLLFEGYGVSRRMRPYHAGLLGVDTLVVLDESHLVPPFERLLEHIKDQTKTSKLGARNESESALIPRFHVLPLSATVRERDGDVFRLTNEDYKDPVVKQRLDAVKGLRFEPLGRDSRKLEERLAEEAWKLSGEGSASARILVYSNSRDVAEKTKNTVEKLAKSSKVPLENFQLFVGARRVKEREDAKNRLEEFGFFSRGEKPEKPTFVIATSAGEVGVDLDADHMVMDLVPFERMVQRLGRVNRLGEKIAKIVAVYENADEPRPKKEGAPTEEEKRAILGWKTFKILNNLPRFADGDYDASPGALTKLKGDYEREVDNATTPEPLYPALTRPLVDAWSMTSLREHPGRPEVAPWLRGWVNDEPQTSLVWRMYLPVRTNGDDASEKEINDFFSAAPPHLTEMLETETNRVHSWLLDRAEKMDEAIRKSQIESDSVNTFPAAAPTTLEEQKVIVIALGRSGEDPDMFKLSSLLRAGETNRGKENLRRSIQNRILVLDARLGGLTNDGLFDAKSADSVHVTVDSAEWFEGEKRQEVEHWERIVGFRIRSVLPDAEGSGGEWCKPSFFDLKRDGEGNPLRQLRVEKYVDEVTTEEDRSISHKKAQTLEKHEEWTEEKARELIEKLGIDEKLGKAIALAARLHDEGKRAPIWQRAFSAKTDGIYAKTMGPFRPALLGGYRHEFGSLGYVEQSNEFCALPEDLRDLVFHLVASHHGNARPVIGTENAEGPPSILEARARDVALRFVKLQKRYGPWGLAWLESILRAADQQASRDLDEARNPNG